MRKALLSLTLVMAIILCMTVAIAPPVLAAGGATDYSSLREYYANNPQPALSNQSLVFDQQGHIVQVVTGKPGAATVVPAAGATIVPGLKPAGTAAAPAATVTPAANATGGKLTASVTAVPPTATPTVVPTKTRSPGFGIILSAMAILGVLFYLNRKK